MKPIWKILIAAAVIVAVVAAVFIIPHYRAKGAVAAYREQLKRQGEKTTIAELVPQLSADEIKAGSEFLAAAAKVGNFTDTPRMMRQLAPGHGLVSWAEEISATENSSNCWPPIKKTATEYREASESLCASLQGPAMVFSVDYSAGFLVPLTYLSVLKKSSLWLSQETVLAMHERDTNAAWASLRAEANLMRMNHGEPLLISQLVRVAVGQIAVSTLWEALQYPGWSEAQLAELQTNWESFDLLDHLESTFAMERVLGAPEFERMRSSFSNYSSMLNPAFFGGSGPRYDSWREILGNPVEGIKVHMRYSAWKSWVSYEEELVTMQAWQAATETTRRIHAGGAFAPELKSFQLGVTNLLKEHPGWQKRFVFSGENPSGFGEGVGEMASRALQRISDMENERRMAVTAIALERFRLRNGKYPVQLQELVPEFLPKTPIDLMDGKPLRYRRRDDATFLLYSAGEDGKDDGGDASPPAEDTSTFKQWYKMRDAVWPMPATPDEVKKYEAETLQKYSQKWPRGGPLPQPRPVRPPASTTKTN